MSYFDVAMSALQIGTAIGGNTKAKKANKAAVELTDNRNKQRVRAFLRNFRKQQALAVAGAGAVAGGLDSSRAQGVISSQRTQAFSGVIEASQMNNLNRKIAKATAGAQQLSLLSNVAGSASNFFASEAGRDLTQDPNKDD